MNTSITSNAYNSCQQTGKLIGVGVGPGDPELMTLKAYRYIQQTEVITYLVNADNISQAKNIAQAVLKKRVDKPIEIPIYMPMNNERAIANSAYDEACISIKTYLQQGKNVVFLCEGDPLFFGSFAYLLTRLQSHFFCEVIPGISSIHAASAVLKQPLTQLTESFAVVSGRHDEAYLCEALKQHDSVVILKAGKSRAKILAALKKAQRFDEACYLAYIGRENEVVEKDISVLTDEVGPYFSLFVVCRKSKRLG
ncbi:precorrin-2 C(20)-methyltransferase [Aliikangiella sp. IMCC44359]|uniref:precorrin-2 C(20)-methyltransferase n=1 Tax=Aliikangiella sp. IMCC44359 TaxID=3459125 RepID=UPI00403A8C23